MNSTASMRQYVSPGHGVAKIISAKDLMRQAWRQCNQPLRLPVPFRARPRSTRMLDPHMLKDIGYSRMQLEYRDVRRELGREADWAPQ